MSENPSLSQPQSSSKRVKKSSSHETSEQLKSHLDSEKHLHEIQCFTEELFATRKASQSGQALSSYVDPVVNLHIDILLSRIKSLSNDAENGEKVNTSAGVTALLQKLTSENESLRRKESVSRMNEKLSHKKDTVIEELKKQDAKSRAWIHELQEQNDRLSSQLFMFQMQHNAYVQQQHSKARVDGDDQHIKKEEDASPQLDNSDD